MSAQSEQDAEADPELDASVTEAATPVVPPPLDDQTPPKGANGLAFDAARTLWLADLAGSQIVRFDAETGEILDRYPQPVAGPDDIVIDERGRVYWTGWLNGAVGRIDPATHENTIIAELPVGANSIAFSADGRLFVGLVLSNRGLYEVDPEGVREPRLVADVGVNAFDFGPDGLLWGPSQAAIIKLDVETGEIVETVTDGGYASVRYHEADNAVYAVRQGTPPVLDRIELDSGDIARFSELNLERVDNFVFGPGGRLYVTGGYVPALVVVDPDGSNGPLIHIGKAPEP